MISFLILINFANHFTESTFKQFYDEKVKFKPDFDSALKIIENSDTNKMIFYIDQKGKKIVITQLKIIINQFYSIMEEQS